MCFVLGDVVLVVIAVSNSFLLAFFMISHWHTIDVGTRTNNEWLANSTELNRRDSVWNAQKSIYDFSVELRATMAFGTSLTSVRHSIQVLVDNTTWTLFLTTNFSSTTFFGFTALWAFQSPSVRHKTIDESTAVSHNPATKHLIVIAFICITFI